MPRAFRALRKPGRLQQVDRPSRTWQQHSGADSSRRSQLVCTAGGEAGLSGVGCAAAIQRDPRPAINPRDR
jgi:hypothetical protein